MENGTILCHNANLTHIWSITAVTQTHGYGQKITAHAHNFGIHSDRDFLATRKIKCVLLVVLSLLKLTSGLKFVGNSYSRTSHLMTMMMKLN